MSMVSYDGQRSFIGVRRCHLGYAWPCQGTVRLPHTTIRAKRVYDSPNQGQAVKVRRLSGAPPRECTDLDEDSSVFGHPTQGLNLIFGKLAASADSAQMVDNDR